MISSLRGTVIDCAEQAVTLNIHGLGLLVGTARGSRYTVGQEVDLLIYFYWHQENGPQLFGFSSLSEKHIFSLIIGCSGIGPKIALAVLEGMTPSEFASAIVAGDIKALSRIDGIGTKKAESMIVFLKDKISKLLQSGALSVETNATLGNMNKISEILTSLGYSRAESSYTLEHLQKTTSFNSLPFDELIRKALAFAASKKQL